MKTAFLIRDRITDTWVCVKGSSPWSSTDFKEASLFPEMDGALLATEEIDRLLRSAAPRHQFDVSPMWEYLPVAIPGYEGEEIDRVMFVDHEMWTVRNNDTNTFLSPTSQWTDLQGARLFCTQHSAAMAASFMLHRIVITDPKADLPILTAHTTMVKMIMNPQASL